MTGFLLGRERRPPPELSEALLLNALDIPLASQWSEIEDLPALLITDHILVSTARADATEWLQLEAERKAKANR